MDPLTIYQDAGLLGIALMLFILNFVQNYGIKKSNEQLVASLKQAHVDSVEAHTDVVAKLAVSVKALTDGQERADRNLLAILKNQDLMDVLKSGQDAALDDLTSVIKSQEVLATNQMNLTHTTNEVVRELITIIRDGERG
jgi:hypothetical protein